jgi:hypothetical protein
LGATTLGREHITAGGDFSGFLGALQVRGPRRNHVLAVSASAARSDMTRPMTCRAAWP